MSLNSKFATALGARAENQDWHLADPACGLFMIADGMGGGDDGALAARLACESARKAWDLPVRLASDLERMSSLMRWANKAVFERGRQVGLDMGTTLTLAAIRDDVLLLGHVGDTRLYRLRDGKAELLSTDQRGPDNTLLQSVGNRQNCEPITQAFDFRATDILVFASDGLWALFKPEQLLQLQHQVPPDELAPALLEWRGPVAGDNASVLVVWSDGAQRQWWRQQIAPLRTRFAAAPCRLTWDAVRHAQTQADVVPERLTELLDAWSLDNEAELSQLARSLLAPTEWEHYLQALVRDRASPRALLDLADLHLTDNQASVASCDVVRKAQALQASVPRANYLLQHNQGLDDAERLRLMQFVLKQTPGPWVETWTRFWEMVMNIDAEGRDGLLKSMPKTLPGISALGEPDPNHPIDRLWIVALQNATRPLQEEQRHLKDEIEALHETESRRQKDLERNAKQLQDVSAQVSNLVQKLASLENSDQLQRLTRDLADMKKSLAQPPSKLSEMQKKIDDVSTRLDGIKESKRAQDVVEHLIQVLTERHVRTANDAMKAQAEPPCDSEVQPDAPRALLSWRELVIIGFTLGVFTLGLATAACLLPLAQKLLGS